VKDSILSAQTGWRRVWFVFGFVAEMLLTVWIYLSVLTLGFSLAGEYAFGAQVLAVFTCCLLALRMFVTWRLDKAYDKAEAILKAKEALARGWAVDAT